MRSVGASQQVPTRSRNYRKRSREIVDNARRYFSLKKFEGSSSSRFEIEPVVRSLICVPHTVSVEKVSTLLKMIVGLQHILVSKMLESRDRLNASNIVIHELQRRIQEYEGSQNRNGDEEDGLVTSEAVLGAGGFDQVNKGCCGTGVFEQGPLCNPTTITCRDVSKYVFWDATHFTEKAYSIIFEANRHIIDYIIN
ncbi:hypothetical protein LguiB_004928 [Lonicera macranthoides]